jgi:hypothetical protein
VGVDAALGRYLGGSVLGARPHERPASRRLHARRGDRQELPAPPARRGRRLSLQVRPHRARRRSAPAPHAARGDGSLLRRSLLGAVRQFSARRRRTRSRP